MHTENDIKIERCKIIKSSKTVNASLKKGVFSFDLKFVYRLGVYQFQQQQKNDSPPNFENSTLLNWGLKEF